MLAHGELPTVDLMSAVDGLRKNGLPDQVIKEIVEGTPVTAERHREAAIIKQQLLGDKAWCAAYRDGSRLHAEQLHRVLAVLTAPIMERTEIGAAMTDRWTYAVPLVDPDGERRVIVVTLSPEERANALYNLAVNPRWSWRRRRLHCSSLRDGARTEQDAARRHHCRSR